MTTGKAIALTIQTFVGKVMSLLFNMLSRFVTAFFPRSEFLGEELGLEQPQVSQRGTREPVDEGERGERKTGLKLNRLYFPGLRNHCRCRW